MDVGGRDEDVDRVHLRLDRRVDVRLVATVQGAYLRLEARVDDRSNRLELTRGVRGKPRLHGVHTEVVEDPRNPHLVLNGQGDPGSLLAVPEGRVEDSDPSVRGPSEDGFVVGAYEHRSARFHAHSTKTQA